MPTGRPTTGSQAYWILDPRRSLARRSDDEIARSNDIHVCVLIARSLNAQYYFVTSASMFPWHRLFDYEQRRLPMLGAENSRSRAETRALSSGTGQLTLKNIIQRMTKLISDCSQIAGSGPVLNSRIESK
jgi:hypothetical protein